MSEKLSPQDFIAVATEPVEEETDERRMDPAALSAMGKLANAMGGPERLEGTKDGHAMHALHHELTLVEKRDPMIHPKTATQRVNAQGQSRIPTSGSRFSMRRDWDPEEEPNPED